MGLALAPQCCCEYAGITRVFGAAYTMRLINVSQDTTGGVTLKHWPCWEAIRGDYDGFAGWPSPVLKPANEWGHVMGLDTVNGRLICGANWGFSAWPKSSIVAVRIRECVVLPGTNYDSGGWSPYDELVGEAEADAIYESTFPGGSGAWVNHWATYSCASDTRLYGFSRYDNADDEAHFLAWSTDYTGGDYIEHFDLSGANRFLVPYTMNVCDDDIYCVAYHDAGDSTALRIYKNGTTLADMVGLVDVTCTSIAKRSGSEQYLMCCNYNGPIGGDKRGLWIVADGENLDDQEIYFAPQEEGSPVIYPPHAITYDKRRDAIAVVWGELTTFGHLLDKMGWTTYIYDDLSIGQILEQPKTFVYANFPAGYGIGGDIIWSGSNPFPSAMSWATPIPGKLPNPITIEAGEIIDDPPPPPDGPTCDGLTECEDVPNLDGGFAEFVDYTQTPGTIGDPYDVVHWFLSNLNMGFSLPYVGSSYVFTLEYVAALNDYGDPGILIFQSESDSGDDFNREGYLTKVEIYVTCTDGLVEVNYVIFYFQIFQDPTGSQIPLGETWFQAYPADQSGPGYAYDCRTSIFSARFYFQDFLLGTFSPMDKGDESQHFDVTVSIGNVE